MAAALIGAVAIAGCGLGPGPSSEGTARLTVTRDYGRIPVAEATETEPRESETVIRFLDGETKITTRYGGGFVQSIDGVAGANSGGRRLDWFFYVNGIESPVGAADVRVRGGDRIWWDYRDWTSAMRVPAVVGSWPEPFLQASTPADHRLPVRIECAGSPGPCRVAADRLDAAGVGASIERFAARSSDGDEAARLLVGPWRAIRRDSAAAELDRGPAESGVFAELRRRRGSGGYGLVGLDEGAEPARALGRDAGLVAALRRRDDPATWLVTGGSPKAVAAAASRLDERDLADRYAIAVDHRTAVPLPVAASGGSV
jgi:hypothetical protein